MLNQMKSDRNLAYKFLIFLENKAYFIIISSSLIILFFTLLPFSFTSPAALSWSYIVNNFSRKTNSLDIIANMILFFPFGLGLAVLLNKTRKPVILQIIIILSFSLLLSVTVETGQIFLATRESSIFDLITNSLGGGLGAVTIFLIDRFNQQLSRLFAWLHFFDNPATQLKSLIILWLSYLFIICFILITVEGSTQLNNWDTKFPLLVGNEVTGDRPWLGKITDFCMTKNAISQQQIKQLLKTNQSCIILKNNSDALVTAYFFNGSHQSYFDLTRNLPNLDNQKKSRLPVTKKGIVINEQNWLKTTFPALKLTQEIQNSSRFTIFTKIATDNFQQEGPARIISLSQNPFWRNFTLAQWHHDLSLRIRMPLTGINGKKPEIRVKNFFTDREVHQLAIAYDGLKLRVYRDSIESEQSLYLGLEAALFWSIFTALRDNMYLNIGNDLFYYFLYYGLMFIPLGICFGLILNRLYINQSSWLFFIIGGLIIPPLMIEGIIATISYRDWTWQYLSLGIIILSISFLLTKAWQQKVKMAKKKSTLLVVRSLFCLVFLN